MNLTMLWRCPSGHFEITSKAHVVGWSARPVQSQGIRELKKKKHVILHEIKYGRECLSGGKMLYAFQMRNLEAEHWKWSQMNSLSKHQLRGSSACRAGS